jgi:16S rRNA G966 N2-methylase RsmD
MNFRNLAYRASEKYWDYKLKIHTYDLIEPEELGISSTDCMQYTPVPYRTLFAMLNAIPDECSDGALIDFGSGMGRVLVVAAAQFQFRRVVGVELADQLCQVAHTNVSQSGIPAHCPIEILNTDASQFAIPDDATVFVFTNPFKGETLQRVMNNIRTSLIRKDRRAALLVYMRKFFDETRTNHPWIVQKFSTKCFPNASWGVYEADMSLL